MNIISFDIGSTYTKGISVQLNEGLFSIKKCCTLASTTNDLSESAFSLIETLRENADDQIYFSSSAKGGLAIAALGIVPDVTLHAAKETALSAGAKITKVFSYKLTEEDIHWLDNSATDILLFSGGTDGGNESYVLHNLSMLKKSKFAGVVVYAGNRVLASQVKQELACMDVLVCENLLPELEKANPEPARKCIRSIFLEKIVKGKGLEEIVSATGAEPLPTPFSVFEFIKCVEKHSPWESFLLVDMGGATTDIYSCHNDIESVGVVRKGMPPQKVKRSVEGDLGMRVSALAAYDAAKPVLHQLLAYDSEVIRKFEAYLKKIDLQRDYLPQNITEQHYDALLAQACFRLALLRHAGTQREIYTANGAVLLRSGKDLTQVQQLIMTGGYLSQVQTYQHIRPAPNWALNESGEEHLLPRTLNFHQDEGYLIPLLANLSKDYPAEAVMTMLSRLKKKE